MIFVTVGTHEQPFNRLVRAMDEYASSSNEKVYIQTGYSTYEPAHCEWSKFISFNDMKSCMKQADVVVTHGGPSSFIEAMSVGKIPVVVPRKLEFGEHVNDHQVDFIRFVAEHQGGIVPVYDIAKLSNAIEEARRLSRSGVDFISHNAEFCRELCKRIERL
ncbi:glycosyltransferase [Bifidobacterium pullorum]|uniref:glycosyltransferase n=1 Tax=Bifidobacterium pullorum TaxID=78448 RepID=UPI0005299B9A|nr:glycosyltransferase [Bifidobacterium pullorum]